MRIRFPAHTARLLLLIAAALILITASAFADPITARVVGVHDGDTITVLTPDKRQIKIRFAEIDAPELSQPYGKKAKQLLSLMVFGKDVSITPVTTDRYRRIVARVFQGNSDINLAMVQAGAAWAYRQYLTDPSLLEAESEARNARTGLWALQPDQITPPWEWRHARTAR
jgi:endonuclease YncB( thermonuclease family)